MAKDKLTDYDSTASGNLDVGGISVAEGMLPSGVNNAIRELMSHQADAFGAGTPLYVDQTNNRLGVGSNNPQDVLDLGDSTGGRGIAWGGPTGTAHYCTIWSEYSSASLVMAAGLKGSTSNEDFINSVTGTIGYAAIELDAAADDGIKFYTAPDAAVTAGTAATKNERMRIDTNGNLLVATTTTDTTAAAGFTVQSDAQIYASANSQHVATLTRLTNDGDIITFRQSAVGGGGLTTVGSIGTLTGDLYLGTADTGLYFDDGLNAILPADTSGPSVSNGFVSLGQSSYRFDSLFLNGSLDGGVGARSTSGTLDWNDATNARSGNGFSLLLGTATNGPGGSTYFHSFCFEYASRGGTGNMTQWAIGYSDPTLRYMRTRFSGTWTSWSAF